MANDADTYLVDTSAGEVNVHYGWESWVVVHRKGSSAKRAVVRNRRGLERLLVDVGVPGIEAEPSRPDCGGEGRRTPVAPRSTTRGRTRGNDTGTLTLVMFLVGLAVVVIAHVVFHIDWVAV